jgi:Ca-activated chloride channel family protein
MPFHYPAGLFSHSGTAGLAGFAAIVFGGALAAQPVLDIRPSRQSVDALRQPDLRVDVNLVLLPVIVTNRSGATVNGLTASSFTVLDGNTPIPIASFGSEDVACSVGVVVDLSGSMQSKAGIAARAMRAFFDTANTEDEAFLLTLATRPGTPTALTNNFADLEEQLRVTQAGGATALTDTIQLALTRLRGAHTAHRALVVISDGMDNHSRYSEAELLRIAQEADVQIFTIGMAPSVANKKAIELTEERNGLAFLDHLAMKTGGLSFTLASYEDPVPTATKISSAIRNQYVIGYSPAESQPGQWRAVKVRVDLPQVHVSTRSGYYSR